MLTSVVVALCSCNSLAPEADGCRPLDDDALLELDSKVRPVLCLLSTCGTLSSCCSSCLSSCATSLMPLTAFFAAAEAFLVVAAVLWMQNSSTHRHGA